MKLISLAFLTLLLSSIVQAQETIYGKIVDQKDSTALSWVTVCIKGKSVGTATNSNGDFALKNVGKNDSLHISMVGFGVVDTVLAPQATHHLIYLKEKVTILPQMNVSPAKVEEILSRIYKSIKENFSTTQTSFIATYREQVVQGSEYAFLGNAQFLVSVPSYWYSEPIKKKIIARPEAKVGDVMVSQNRIDKHLNFKIPPGAIFDLMYPVYGMVETPEYFDYKITRQFYWNKANYISIWFKTKDKYWKDLPVEGNILINADENVVASISWNTERKDEKSTGFFKGKIITVVFKSNKYTQKVFFEKKQNGLWGLKYAQIFWDLNVFSEKANINQKYTLIGDLLVTKDNPTGTFEGEDLNADKDFFEKKTTNPTAWDRFDVIVPDFSIKDE